MDRQCCVTERRGSETSTGTGKKRRGSHLVLESVKKDLSSESGGK